MPSIHLTPAELQDLLATDRRSANPEVRLRSDIFLLHDAGHSWASDGLALAAVGRSAVGLVHQGARSSGYRHSEGRTAATFRR